MAPALLHPSNMAEPDGDRAERKVVVETTTSTSTKNSAVAWIIIGVLAAALVVWILVHMK
jgi:hypothetical protein